MTVVPWWKGVLPVFDLETTGTDPREARIVTAALLLCLPDGTVQPGGVDVIVNPGVPIPDEAAAVHGITTERARADGIEPAEAVDQILTCLRGIAALGWPLVIYNATYDWVVLHHEVWRHAPRRDVPAVPILDPLVLDRGNDRYRKGSRKLGDVCAHYGVRLEGAHDARADAAATAALLRAMVGRFPELQAMTFEQLQDVQADMHAAWVQSFNAYRAARGEPPIEAVRWPGVELVVAR